MNDSRKTANIFKNLTFVFKNSPLPRKTEQICCVKYFSADPTYSHILYSLFIKNMFDELPDTAWSSCPSISTQIGASLGRALQVANLGLELEQGFELLRQLIRRLQ